MFGLKDLVNFASTSASGDGKIVIFTPQVSTHACKIFIRNLGVSKNRDKLLANDIQLAKFTKVFPHHNFVLYSSSGQSSFADLAYLLSDHVTNFRFCIPIALK